MLSSQEFHGKVTKAFIIQVTTNRKVASFQQRQININCIITNLGQPQSQDELVYGGTEEQKHRYIFGGVTEDDRYLIISGANSTSGNDLLYQRSY